MRVVFKVTNFIENLIAIKQAVSHRIVSYQSVFCVSMCYDMLKRILEIYMDR